MTRSIRHSGVLLHVTSLPGLQMCGTLGAEAYRWLDFIHNAGFSVWQMLPLAPTHADLSPYNGLSAFAGNPRLIDRALLQEWGWLEGGTDAGQPGSSQDHIHTDGCGDWLDLAWAGFAQRASPQEREDYAHFCQSSHFWLDDYALFQACRAQYQGKPWMDWPDAIRDRRPLALENARLTLRTQIERVCFEQFLFWRQWQALRQHARQQGICLFGDLAIFVAQDSADVWAHRDLFKLNPDGRPAVVAGVPPDYFSATGQRWGNPLYRWDRMEAQGFRWWSQRLAYQLAQFDLLRIDHFRGFQACWEIPAQAQTAAQGQWVAVPGQALFRSLQQNLGSLPLVAEDLGSLTEEVHALREAFDLPGMLVLQFAFSGGAENPYLPHRHAKDAVVYLGTHDNDTALGWFSMCSNAQQDYIREYLGFPTEAMPWPLVRTTLASVANLAILPLQDLLALGSEHRMNTPGTSEGNWRWRLDPAQLTTDLASQLLAMNQLYGRCHPWSGYTWSVP